MGQINNIGAEVSGYIQRGISSAEVTPDGVLVLTLTDGTELSLGKVKGEDSVPTFVIVWKNGMIGGVMHPTAEEKEEMIRIKKAVDQLGIGKYRLFLSVSGKKIAMSQSTDNGFMFFDPATIDKFKVYTVKFLPSDDVLLSEYDLPENDFDEESESFVSAAAIAEYVDQKIAASAMRAGNGISIVGGVISLSGGAS